MSDYRNVPTWFCEKLVTKIFRDKELQEDIEDLLETRDNSLMDGVGVKTRAICAESCKELAIINAVLKNT
ncbi:hypothetical protein OESDEN_09204 [Oesophagostomum dentatum]|uniref:Uncharacterized protein n=1 Tax=Oesophagostomum dentatum TaxID=61180 RepID=A0A0B1T062_OESDE|nr:hypothetical protein OESDEN_09204 [Oesophagostomum dentatum]